MSGKTHCRLPYEQTCICAAADQHAFSYIQNHLSCCFTTSNKGVCGLLQVMLELTQQSLAFQQERSQLTEMLQAQHVHMQQLVEENQTQEAALNGLSQHAQQADQKVQTDITTAIFADLYPGRVILQVCHIRALARMSVAVGYQSVSRQSHLQACCQCEFNS